MIKPQEIASRSLKTTENPFGWWFPPSCYEPIEGGFSITNGPNLYNVPLVHRQNYILTGDKPIFKIYQIYLATHYEVGYGGSSEKLHSLLGAKSGATSYGYIYEEVSKWLDELPNESGKVLYGLIPCLGRLRLGIITKKACKWLDEFDVIKTYFNAGNTQYRCYDKKSGLEIYLSILPLLNANGAICKVNCHSSKKNEFKLAWVFGNMGLKGKEFFREVRNEVKIKDGYFELKDDTLPKALVYAGCDFPNQELSLINGDTFYLDTISPEKVLNSFPGNNQLSLVKADIDIDANRSFNGYILTLWGTVDYDKEKVTDIFKKVDSLDATKRFKTRIKNDWFKANIGMALNPEEGFKQHFRDLKEVYKKSEIFWKDRSNQLVIKTPNEKLNSLATFTAACSEYFHQPPSHLGGYSRAEIYGHISAGQWHGKEAIGDHDQIDTTLRFYGALNKDGNIRWATLYLTPLAGEDNSYYWIDQVYNHYCWTGNKKFVKDMWPIVKKAVDWELKVGDPDKDGLFRSYYEFWNSDCHLKGPKVSTTSCLAYNMLKRASEMGKAVGDNEIAKRYAKLAVQINTKIMDELWVSDIGILSSICPSGVRRLHPEAMEVFLPVLYGNFDEIKSYQMLRFIRDNLWVTPKPGITLQFMNDWWPIVWSHHYIHVGDTLQTVLAACKSGDIDNYYRILETIANSAFYTNAPHLRNVIFFDGSLGEITEESNSTEPLVWSITEGLFGIKPRLQENTITITPNFPSNWVNSSITIPDISYKFDKVQGRIEIEVVTPVVRKKILRIGVRSDVKEVLVNGKKVSFSLEPGVNRCYVIVKTRPEKISKIEIILSKASISISYNKVSALNLPSEVIIENVSKIEILDPQEVVHVENIIDRKVKFFTKRTGSHTFFLKLTSGNIALFQPVDLEIKERFEIPIRMVGANTRKKIPSKIISPNLELERGVVNFNLINNCCEDLRSTIRTTFLSTTTSKKVYLKKYDEITLSHEVHEDDLLRLTPGKNMLIVEVNNETYRVPVINWDMMKSNPNKKFCNRLIALDLKEYYNDSAESFLKRKFLYDIGLKGKKDPILDLSTLMEPRYHSSAPEITLPDLGGIVRTESGIFFETENDAKNILALANWEPHVFPSKKTITINKRIEKIYFLMLNYFYPTKSYLPNGKVEILYEDATRDTIFLVPPYNMDVYFQHFSIEGKNVKLGTLVKSGWAIAGGDDIHADIIDFITDTSKMVKQIEIYSTCTESILGILGITLVQSV